MDLRARHEHMHGRSVLVDGQTYPVAEDGSVRNVPEHAAALLLQNWRGWEVLEPAPPLMPVDADGVPEFLAVASVAAPSTPAGCVEAELAATRVMVDGHSAAAAPAAAPKVARRGRPKKGSAP